MGCAGEVRAIRFYRGLGNPSGYRVHLWAAGSGQLLGSGNVVEGQCAVPCWQEVQLWPQVALADGVEGGNSVYAYGSQTTFPTASWTASNYFVDVRFVTP